MDRRDGTGRGHRGDRREGQSRGGWGGNTHANEAKPEDGENKAATEEETKELRRERMPEPVEEEEEEVGFTLDDYMAQKSANSKGMLTSTGGGR